ncbi:unnamed protein product [Linum trigynum]|uniref:Uncharacterized protein n=1 Tax=Linum trigynum TaxID=586398 RepID=A0AAV2FWJ6_9ROSI
MQLSMENAWVFVTEQVSLEIKIGSYVDQIQCEVVPMKLTQVVLGKPWHNDHQARRSMSTNNIILRHQEKKLALIPLSLKGVAEDRRQLQQAYDEEQANLEVEKLSINCPESQKEKEQEAVSGARFVDVDKSDASLNSIHGEEVEVEAGVEEEKDEVLVDGLTIVTCEDDAQVLISSQEEPKFEVGEKVEEEAEEVKGDILVDVPDLSVREVKQYNKESECKG